MILSNWRTCVLKSQAKILRITTNDRSHAKRSRQITRVVGDGHVFRRGPSASWPRYLCFSNNRNLMVVNEPPDCARMAASSSGPGVRGSHPAGNTAFHRGG